MSTLVLIRHGQAMFGAENYDQLSNHGIAQAKACGDYWRSRDTRFSRILIGPRQRHRDTARFALEGLPEAPTEMVADLDEFGENSRLLIAAEQRSGLKLTGGTSAAEVSRAEVMRQYRQQIRLWGEDAITMEGIDSVVKFRRRIAHWLDAITARNEPGENILASTSGGVIAAVLSEMLGLSNVMMSDLMWNVGNCSLSAIVWSERGRGLHYFNQTGHLPEALSSGV